MFMGIYTWITSGVIILFFFPQNFADTDALSSTMSIVNSDTGLILFTPCCCFFLTVCLKHSVFLKFRHLTRKYLYSVHSESNYPGIQCFLSTCRVCSFFASGNFSSIISLATSSLFICWALCFRNTKCIKCWLIFSPHVAVPNDSFLSWFILEWTPWLLAGLMAIQVQTPFSSVAKCELVTKIRPVRHRQQW